MATLGREVLDKIRSKFCLKPDSICGSDFHPDWFWWVDHLSASISNQKHISNHVWILTSTSCMNQTFKNTAPTCTHTTFACSLLIWEWTFLSARLFRHWCPNFGLKLLRLSLQFRWTSGTIWNHSYWIKTITVNAQQCIIYTNHHQFVDFGFFLAHVQHIS